MRDKDYYDFGCTVFGPFLYGFTQWLRDKIKENGDNKVFFFSRDGYIMQKVWMLYEKQEPLELEQNYVYFSRNSLRRGLLWQCKTYEESLQYLSKERFIEFAEIASYYGLEKKELLPLLNEVRMGWTENLLYEKLPKNKKVQVIYEAFKSVIIKKSHEQYELVIAYLKQIGMNGSCAIVDIGWHGSMQYYLEQLIEKANLDIKLNGYYVGVNPILPMKGRVEGYLFHEGDLKLRKSVLCFFGGIEKLFQSLEGSTDSYYYDDNVLLPKLKKYEYETDKQIQYYIMQLQMGALEYVKRALAEYVIFKDEKDAFTRLIKFGKNPNFKDTQLFSFFYNYDGGKLYFLPQKPIYRYEIKEFIQAFSNSAWKTGFMKAAFRLPFPYYWIYSIIRK